MSDTKKDMIEVNKVQKDFYESRFDAKGAFGEKKAGIATNVWTMLRRRQQSYRYTISHYKSAEEIHKQWLESCVEPGFSVLDLGCFSGNALSLWLAERSNSYLGIDLSEKAISALQNKLNLQGFTHANAKAMDLLNNDFPDNSFDIVYAHSVLHHFKDINVVLEELRRIVKPGGYIVTFDPLNTSLLMKMMRLAYRPLQTDKEWEFPFTRQTLKLFDDRFTVADALGFMGFAKYGLLFSLVPGLGWLGDSLGRMGFKLDMRYSTGVNSALYQCLQVALLLKNDKK